MLLSLRLFLTIILFVLASTELIGQNLKLEILSKDQMNIEVIDSIGYKSTFDNFKPLEAEVKALVEKLWRTGFIDTTIEDFSKVNDTLFKANLSLGQRLALIRIYYDSKFNPKLLQRIETKSGENYFEVKVNELEETLNQLNISIAENGDPFSSLQLTNLKKMGSSTITATLKIRSKQKRRIDKIVIKGYEKFPKSYLKRYLRLQTGKSFNLTEIKDKVELLEDIRFANKIKDPEVLFTTDSTTLYLYIEKIKTNNFDGFLGFGTNETTNKLDFDGYVDLRLTNNLNYGETLNLFYKSDEIDQQTFRVDMTLPYLFGSPVGLQLGLNIFRKDSSFLNAQQYAKLNYQINARNSLKGGFEFTNSTNLLDDSSTSVIDDYTSSFYALNYQYIKPQFYDVLFPVNFFFDLSSGFGSRETTDKSQSQSNFKIQTYKIFNLNPNNSFFLRLSGALLLSDDYFDNELYRFGGINSIRGFEENSLVANLFGVVNTEYRYRLSKSIYVHSVFDAAYFENDITDTEEKLFGFGFGFGLLTNAGLFRLNYSSGKSENRPFRLADSKIHISLTATF